MKGVEMGKKEEGTGGPNEERGEVRRVGWRNLGIKLGRKERGKACESG